ncbi:MAG: methyltransferase family protein [Gammaproteobacteria bacterium]
MHEPWRSLPWAIAFWIVYILVFSLEARWMIRSRDADNTEVRECDTSCVIVGAMFIAVALAFWFADRSRTFYFGWQTRSWFFLGLALMLAGVALRQWAMSALGPHFTGEVVIQAGHRLVETGLYGHIRHPAYSGAFLIWLGLGLALTNGVSLLILGIAAALAYGLRIRAEEAALTVAFGERYRDYCRKTRRFVPGLF